MHEKPPMMAKNTVHGKILEWEKLVNSTSELLISVTEIQSTCSVEQINGLYSKMVA